MSGNGKLRVFTVFYFLTMWVLMHADKTPKKAAERATVSLGSLQVTPVGTASGPQNGAVWDQGVTGPSSLLTTELPSVLTVFPHFIRFLSFANLYLFFSFKFNLEFDISYLKSDS